MTRLETQTLPIAAGSTGSQSRLVCNFQLPASLMVVVVRWAAQDLRLAARLNASVRVQLPNAMLLVLYLFIAHVHCPMFAVKLGSMHQSEPAKPCGASSCL